VTISGLVLIHEQIARCSQRKCRKIQQQCLWYIYFLHCQNVQSQQDSTQVIQTQKQSAQIYTESGTYSQLQNRTCSTSANSTMPHPLLRPDLSVKTSARTTCPHCWKWSFNLCQVHMYQITSMTERRVCVRMSLIDDFLAPERVHKIYVENLASKCTHTKLLTSLP
jgi:hypothetical protein